MAKYLILLLFLLFISGCQNQNIISEKDDPIISNSSIDAVEKKSNLNKFKDSKNSSEFLKLLGNWIDNDVKTIGFNGTLNINLISISTAEILIDDGVRIQTEIEIDFLITKTTLEKKKLIQFKGEEFVEITGDFSLNDKKIEIDNISKRLIQRLSNKLSQEVN